MAVHESDGVDAGVTRGPGPRWFRLGRAGLACVYYAALVKHPPDLRWLRPVAYFTEATSLFPRASSFAIE